MSKILFVSGGPLDFGGITSWMYNYLKYMNMNEYQVEILVHGKLTGEREFEFDNLGIKVHHVPYRKDNFWFNFIKVRAVIWKGNYDVIHSHMDAMNSTILKIAKQAGVPIRISHVHSTTNLNEKAGRKIYHNFIKKKIAKYATCMMACSEQAARYYYGNSSDYILMPNAIDVDKYKFSEVDRNYIRKKWRIGEDEILIGQVGHFTDNKNQQYTLRLAKKMIGDGKRIKVLFVGNGELLDKVKEMAEDFGLQEKVIFVGEVRDVYRYYSAMDILLQPSKHEGLPLTVIEAQYVGLPIVISKGIPEEAVISTAAVRKELIIEEWYEECINLWSNTINNKLLDKETYNIEGMLYKLVSNYEK